MFLMIRIAVSPEMGRMYRLYAGCTGMLCEGGNFVQDVQVMGRVQGFFCRISMLCAGCTGFVKNVQVCAGCMGFRPVYPDTYRMPMLYGLCA